MTRRRGLRDAGIDPPGVVRSRGALLGSDHDDHQGRGCIDGGLVSRRGRQQQRGQCDHDHEVEQTLAEEGRGDVCKRNPE